MEPIPKISGSMMINGARHTNECTKDMSAETGPLERDVNNDDAYTLNPIIRNANRMVFLHSTMFPKVFESPIISGMDIYLKASVPVEQTVGLVFGFT